MFLSLYTVYCVHYILCYAFICSGRHNEKRESHGASMIIDPWGTIGSAVLNLLSFLSFPPNPPILSLNKVLSLFFPSLFPAQ